VSRSSAAPRAPAAAAACRLPARPRCEPRARPPRRRRGTEKEKGKGWGAPRRSRGGEGAVKGRVRRPLRAGGRRGGGRRRAWGAGAARALPPWRAPAPAPCAPSARARTCSRAAVQATRDAPRGAGAGDLGVARDGQERDRALRERRRVRHVQHKDPRAAVPEKVGPYRLERAAQLPDGQRGPGAASVQPTLGAGMDRAGPGVKRGRSRAVPERIKLDSKRRHRVQGLIRDLHQALLLHAPHKRSLSGALRPACW